VEPSDVQTIQSIVTQVLHAIDMRRWAALPPLFADEVTTDYTSLFGGDVQRQPRKQLIDGWQHLLSSLDATQHLLGPIDVRVRDTHAVAECHVRGYHVLEEATGGREWMVAGHYIFELETQAGVWHVSKLTLRNAVSDRQPQSAERGCWHVARVPLNSIRFTADTP
jgi:hypothetical protein